MKTASIAIVIIFLVIQLSPAGEKLKTSLPVKGMHCKSCVSMIKKAVRKVDGVKDVTVNLDSGKVELEYSTAQSLSEAIKAIARMGYKVVDPDSVAQTESKVNHK
ncbi:MAG: heavy-metal-associated domain-containing protein [Ignavibacteriae bacterium]|nr:heavy-metal-associated domain-containing protein [Ignavibacteriota bacterium]